MTPPPTDQPTEAGSDREGIEHLRVEHVKRLEGGRVEFVGRGAGRRGSGVMLIDPA
jgi:hypothetical protein